MNSSDFDSAASSCSGTLVQGIDKGFHVPSENGQPGVEGSATKLETLSPAERHKKVVDCSKRGHQLLKAKKFRQAKDLFEQAFALEQDNPYILTGLGECLKNLGEISRAIECYEKLLELEPDNRFALRGLGDIYKMRKDFGRAIDLWLEYLKYRANDIFVLTRIADGYKSLGRFQEAEAYYHKILALNPEDQFSLMGLADLYHKTGQEKQAIVHYEKVLQKSPDLINILTIVGNLHWHCGEVQSAMDCFTRALKLDPHNTYALYGMGNCYRWNRDYQSAIQCWEPLLDTEDVTVALLSRLGDIYRNVGKFEESEKVYFRALRGGYDKFAQLGLLKLYCLQGREQDVCLGVDVFFAKEGFDLKIVEDLCGFFLQTGRKAAAIRFVRYNRARTDLAPDELRALDARVAKLEEQA